MRFSRICPRNNFPENPWMPRFALFSLALIFVMGAHAEAQESTYTLMIKDHKFQPTEIEIPAGQKIALTVKNNDPTPEEFESTDLNREKLVTPGQTITVFLGPLTPGEYKFFGDFHQDTAQGKVIAE